MHDKNLPHRDNTDADSEDGVAQLLAKAGSRAAPAARVAAEVRAAVHAEWQHLLAQKRSRRRWLAIAATVLMLLGSGVILRNLQPTPTSTPVLSRVIGNITQLQGQLLVNDQRVLTSVQIHEGDTLRTAQGGVRIELGSGISLRIAADTILQWRRADLAQLQHGSVFVDSHGADSHAATAPLVLQTALGSVRHVGTRYFVAADAESLQVAVRAGQVSISGADAQLTVNAMEQVQVHADRQLSRADLLPDDPEWQWAATLSEPFMLENRSVAEFLHWVADETGYQLHYANKDIERAAEHTFLHGQQTQAPPLQALHSVLSVTDFHATAQGKTLEVTQSR